MQTQRDRLTTTIKRSWLAEIIAGTKRHTGLWLLRLAFSPL